MRKPIYVTKSFVPPLKLVRNYMNDIWTDGVFANRGPRVVQFEQRFQERFDLQNPLLLVNNGTTALMLALRLLPQGSEVITTPFSYIATSSSISWQGLQPKFVDISPTSLNIDLAKVEAAIGPNTSAILATHVYGNPCDVVGLEALAAKHSLLLIFDAAHAVGVRVMEKSIFDFGDVSTTSFHATKVIHCGEGGGVCCKSEANRKLVFKFHNFGHVTPTQFDTIGINGKIPELSAALGLAVLDCTEEIFSGRRQVHEWYVSELKTPLIELPIWSSDAQRNYAYFPLIFQSDSIREHAENKLQAEGVFPRRYFYPSLNTLDFLSPMQCPISESISKRVLCLPMYPDLKHQSVRKICSIVNSL